MHTSNSDNSDGYGLGAFVCGAVVGLAIGMLYAPTSGERMRSRLTKRFHEGVDRASEMVDEGREFVDRQAQTVRDTVQRGTDAFDQAREDARG